MIELQECIKCKETKPLSEFNKDNKRKAGVRRDCRVCTKLAAKKYLSEPKNKAARDEYRKKYRENPLVIERRKAYMKNWHIENKSEQKDYQTNRDNRDRCNHRVRERRETEPLFKLKQNIRSRTGKAFKSKGIIKLHKNEEMLGCTYEFMRDYLVSQFTEGMTLENYGEWHIDHIIPLASAKTEKELLALAHYTNLQPLWAEDNIKKGDKIL